MALKTDKIGVTGGMTTREIFMEKPRLHIFGVSFNSAKAHLALRISSIWKERGAEIVMMDIMGANYKTTYARLNPNMTVPTLEIDDKVINDSDIMCDFLREKYPGRGDAAVATAGRNEELTKFCKLVEKWDEGLFTYGKMAGDKGGGLGALSNKLRDIRLRQNYQRLSNPADKTWDGRTFMAIYEQKIAYILKLSGCVDGEMDAEKRANTEKNEKVLEEILTEAEKVYRATNQAGSIGFLFGSELSTADAYFAPVLFRIESMDKQVLENTFRKFPRLRDYWQNFSRSSEGQQAITKFTMAWAQRFSVSKCIPCAMLRMKIGCLVAPILEPAAESRIQAFLQKSQAAPAKGNNGTIQGFFQKRQAAPAKSQAVPAK